MQNIIEQTWEDGDPRGGAGVVPRLFIQPQTNRPYQWFEQLSPKHPNRCATGLHPRSTPFPDLY